MAGGINTYAYVDNNPINYFDPYGLAKWDKWWGLPKKFRHWYHRKEKVPGDPDILEKETAEEFHREWERLGKPGPDNKGKHRRGRDKHKRDRGSADLGLLEWMIPWWLTPSELGCADLDCDRDGVPDYEEEDLCR